MRLDELRRRVLLLENVVAFSLDDVCGRARERAIRKIYVVKAASCILRTVQTFFPDIARRCLLLGADSVNGTPTGTVNTDTVQGDILSPAKSRALLAVPGLSSVQDAAPDLYDAVSLADQERAICALRRMGVLDLRSPRQFGSLELIVAAVIGPGGLVPMVELAVLAAEMDVFNRAAAYVAACRAASPGPLELHDLHTVEGMLELSKGNTGQAKEHLSTSIRVCRHVGNLISRGPLPNLLLARGLLDSGEEASVIEYLRACQLLWTPCAGAIDEWIEAIKKGPKPAPEPELLRVDNSRMTILKMQTLVLIGVAGRRALS